MRKGNEVHLTGAADRLERIRLLEWCGVVLVLVRTAIAMSRHC